MVNRSKMGKAIPWEHSFKEMLQETFTICLTWSQTNTAPFSIYTGVLFCYISYRLREFLGNNEVKPMMDKPNQETTRPDVAISLIKTSLNETPSFTLDGLFHMWPKARLGLLCPQFWNCKNCYVATSGLSGQRRMWESIFNSANSEALCHFYLK